MPGFRSLHRTLAFNLLPSPHWNFRNAQRADSDLPPLDSDPVIIVGGRPKSRPRRRFSSILLRSEGVHRSTAQRVALVEERHEHDTRLSSALTMMTGRNQDLNSAFSK